MVEAVKRLKSIGGEQVDIDFKPFAETAILLYGGAFVAERYSGEFLGGLWWEGWRGGGRELRS